MPTPLHKVLVIGLTAALLAVSGALLLIAGPALEGLDGAADRAALEREQRRGERLESLQEAMRRSRAGKRQIVRELRAGRLSLAEAAARFRALDRFMPDALYSFTLRQGFPGRSDEERLCRKLIDFLRVEEADQAGTARLVGRLEAELAEHLRRSGPPRRPACAP